MKNLAIVSPALNAYSETFIQKHKRIPGFKIHFYYGGPIPTHKENTGTLSSNQLIFRSKRFLLNSLNQKSKTFEYALFRRHLKRDKIDCLLAEYGPVGAMLTPICQDLKIPLIVHFHGYDATRQDFLDQYADSYQRMFKYAHSIVVVSRKMIADLKKMGCPEHKIKYNVYGPDESFGKIDALLNTQTFLSVGRFVDKKAPYLTLLAFQKILSEFPNAKLIMAGEGYLLNTCENLVKINKLEKNVKFPGVISKEQFQDYLRISLAYVQHSIVAADGDCEGTPVSILEAAYAGVPVIATRHAGIPDVIKHGQTGLLCNEFDINKMAHHMKLVIKQIDFARNLGASGKVFIQNNANIEKHLTILKDLANYAIEQK